MYCKRRKPFSHFERWANFTWKIWLFFMSNVFLCPANVTRSLPQILLLGGNLFHILREDIISIEKYDTPLWVSFYVFPQTNSQFSTDVTTWKKPSPYIERWTNFRVQNYIVNSYKTLKLNYFILKWYVLLEIRLWLGRL